MNLATVITAAMNFKAKAPAISRKLDIAHDTPAQTLAKMAECGGWVVDLAAFPSTRPVVENWLCEALDRSYASRKPALPKGEREQWALVAEQLTACMAHAGGVCHARQLEIDKAGVSA